MKPLFSFFCLRCVLSLSLCLSVCLSSQVRMDSFEWRQPWWCWPGTAGIVVVVVVVVGGGGAVHRVGIWCRRRRGRGSHVRSGRHPPSGGGSGCELRGRQAIPRHRSAHQRGARIRKGRSHELAGLASKSPFTHTQTHMCASFSLSLSLSFSVKEVTRPRES